MSKPSSGYDTDLTVEQYELVKDVIVRQTNRGRPTVLDLHQVLNAIFYLLRTGCQWRLLPHDFPAWQSVRYYFDKWTHDGTWENINGRLVAQARVADERNPSPSMVLLDSQSVKTSEVGGIRGIDGNKKVKGRKRQIVTDTQGNMLGVLVFAANNHDTCGGAELLENVIGEYPTIEKVLADQGYRGDWALEMQDEYDVVIEIVTKDPNQKGFVVQKGRWVVERSFAWLNRNRRLSKDYERKPIYSEAVIYLASIYLLIRHLQPDPDLPTPYKNKQRTEKRLQHDAVAA